MEAEELRRVLETGSETDRIATIAALEPAIDRTTWGIVAESAYLSNQPLLKDAASLYFRRCATLYGAERISPSFHMIPWDSDQLVEENDFTAIFESVRLLTEDFSNTSAEILAQVLIAEPRSLVVLRMIAAYSRNQISYLLRDLYDVTLSGDDLRTIEQRGAGVSAGVTRRWQAACPNLGTLLNLAVRGELLPFRAGIETDKFRPLHNKIDTRDGWDSVAQSARDGLPYSALLYQRYVGGTFGQAVNASTSLKADLLEGPVSVLFRENQVPFYRVGAREAVPGWEQAPDFFIPNREEPVAVIESKVAEDGGTARDKASRIERLSRLAYGRNVTMISVIDGLGFLRINDVLAPILGNSKGLVFTYDDLEEMLNVPAINRFVGTAPPA